MSNLKGTIKCPICLENFTTTATTIIPNNKEGNIPVAKSCGHVFHRSCIGKSVTSAKHISRHTQKICPICRFANRAYNITLNFGPQMAYVNEERVRRLGAVAAASAAPEVPEVLPQALKTETPTLDPPVVQVQQQQQKESPSLVVEKTLGAVVQIQQQQLQSPLVVTTTPQQQQSSALTYTKTTATIPTPRIPVVQIQSQRMPLGASTSSRALLQQQQLPAPGQKQQQLPAWTPRTPPPRTAQGQQQQIQAWTPRTAQGQQQQQLAALTFTKAPTTSSSSSELLQAKDNQVLTPRPGYNINFNSFLGGIFGNTNNN